MKVHYPLQDREKGRLTEIPSKAYESVVRSSCPTCIRAQMCAMILVLSTPAMRALLPLPHAWYAMTWND